MGWSIAFPVMVFIVLRHQTFKFLANIFGNAGVGVFVQCYAGGRVGDENIANTTSDSAGLHGVLDFLGNILKIYP